MDYFFSFITGIITFISPCMLPMLPVYLSFFAAGASNKTKTLVNVGAFILGFTIVFVVLGAGFGALGWLIRMEYRWLVSAIAGLLIVFLGLNFLGVINIGFLNRSRGINANTKDLNLLSSLFFGLVFACAMGPCTVSFMSYNIAQAVSEASVFKGVVLLFIYSMGLGVPFILSAFLLDRLKGVFDFIKRNYKIINLVCGILLIVLGVIMALNGVLMKYGYQLY